jgi:ribosomal protein S18 acetylase RimI-like enzyme
VVSVVHYRTFRNTDPPQLTQVWNEVFAGNGGVRLASNSALEHFVFAKPYFDPAGLVVAEEDGQCLGFCHAGFGPDTAQTSLSTDTGIICQLGVRPARRRQGIGRKLLEHGENYLRVRGASVIIAGPHPPLCPFYQGLYGGSQPPGFLSSQPEADAFLAALGYRTDKEILIFRRRVSDPIRWSDPRQVSRLSQFEMRVTAGKNLGSWWRECVWAPLEPLEFLLCSKAGDPVAGALAWDMGGHEGTPAIVGIQDLEVKQELRRQGMGRLFVALLFRFLHEQYFEYAEMHTEQEQATGREFCRRLGFSLADRGRVYRKL